MEVFLADTLERSRQYKNLISLIIRVQIPYLATDAPRKNCWRKLAYSDCRYNFGYGALAL